MDLREGKHFWTFFAGLLVTVLLGSGLSVVISITLGLLGVGR